MSRLPLAFGAATSTLAQDFSVERIATGLSRPVFLTAPPADTSRVFIVEQRSGSTGRIQLLPLPSGSATTFLSISPVATGSEQGLLGLAFHPDFATNGYFYVNFTDAAGDTRIVRYHADGDPPTADPASATMVLSISQPQSNHNGGWMAFGPDRYLYVATGDGGGGNDNGVGHTPEIGNAQDGTDNLLGKILRLDVDGDDFPGDATRRYAIPDDNPFVGEALDDEIWALGLRNPWRPSFDRATGDLYIADVGQGAREEIDVEPANGSGGENYGWRLREGTIATPPMGGVGDRPRPAPSTPSTTTPTASDPARGDRSPEATSTGVRRQRCRAATSSPTMSATACGPCAGTARIPPASTARTPLPSPTGPTRRPSHPTRAV